MASDKYEGKDLDYEMDEARRIEREIGAVIAFISQQSEGKPKSRAELHEMLDACLDLEDLHRDWPFPSKNRPDEGPASDAARPLAKALAIGAFGWMEQPTPHIQFAKKPYYILQWNDRSPNVTPALCIEIAFRLERAAHALPNGMITELVNALYVLGAQSGTTPPLLRAVRHRERGANPSLARQLEEEFWCWIFFQKGRGASIVQARSAVAKAACVGTHAVDKWREAWMARTAEMSGGARRKIAKWARSGLMGRSFIDGWTLEDAAKRWRSARLPVKATTPVTPKPRSRATT